MKISIKQLKEIIKEQVEEAWQDNADGDMERKLRNQSEPDNDVAIESAINALIAAAVFASNGDLYNARRNPKVIKLKTALLNMCGKK